MTTVYLIRHSVRLPKDIIESYNTTQNIVELNEKIILSTEGEERAKVLCSSAELQNIDVVYCSNMVRTIQTAKYLLEAQNLRANIDERLNEKTTGTVIDPDYFRKQYVDIDFRNVDGESQREVRKRFDEAFDEIVAKHKDKRIAIFSHGGAISFFLCRYCKLEVEGDRLIYYFNGKQIFNNRINAPEVFKLTMNGNEVTDIEFIDLGLPYKLGI